MHELVQSYLSFDKIKSSNHQCLFSYLCVKHEDLDFDWNFFELIRTKRNGINYYSFLVLEKDWKECELGFKIYIDLLKKKIFEKLQ